MVQPDARLIAPVLRVRGAIIAIMLLTYTVLWQLWRLAPPTPQLEPKQFGIMAGIMAIDAVLSIMLFVILSPRRNALLVHLNLMIDTLATTSLVMCTGYSGSGIPLFYLLILLAAGLLYGQTTGIYYFLSISLANLAALLLDHYDPLVRSAPRQTANEYLLMGVALPLVAFPLLLVFRLTHRGRYFEALYDNISDGLFILDDVGRIIEANGQAAQMTAANRSELVGMPLESLVAVGEGGASVIQTQLQRCLSGETVSFELLLARGDGEPLPVEITAQSVTGLSPGRVQAFARDISARRMMEAEIRRQNEELRRANQEMQVSRDVALNASRLKSQFLANMSHELRTPLNSIIGYTQFVLDDKQKPLDHVQREDLGRVLRSARHLLDLINGVLDLARIESGRESVSISRFELRDLMDSVIDSVTPMAKGKGLLLECSIQNEVPSLQTDEKKLRQILLNLIANALKFTDRGSVRIECGCEADSLTVTVSDTGVGIPPEHLEEIFNEFHQVGPSTHKQYGGTGLGLAIVRRLVELLKGTIQVQSTVGVGSTFSLTIPFVLSLTHDAAPKSTVVATKGAEPAAQENASRPVMYPVLNESVASPT
jgi:PAS domain S-box-containing protein